LQVAADFAREKIIYLSVTWNRRRPLRRAIDVDRMIAALAEKLAAVTLKVSD
jgi:hypothetical protein